MLNYLLQSDAQPSLPEDNQLSTSSSTFQLINGGVQGNHPKLESVPLPLENQTKIWVMMTEFPISCKRLASMKICFPKSNRGRIGLKLRSFHLLMHLSKLRLDCPIVTNQTPKFPDKYSCINWYPRIRVKPLCKVLANEFLSTRKCRCPENRKWGT